jgi:hypothetical protein
MGEERKNATNTVTCQIDDLRLVAGNVICLSAGLKIRLAGCNDFNLIIDLALCNRFYAATAPPNSIYLFNLDLCTRSLDLFLDLIRLLLGHAFLDRFGRAFYQRFRLRKAESWNRAPHLFDYCNLVCAHFC